jgi:hypothetical protein
MSKAHSVYCASVSRRWYLTPSMSLWTTTRFHVRFHRARYLTHSYPLSRAGSGANTLSFLSPIAITSVARSAGLFVQPSPDAPSGWLVLSALFGLPITLWAYKVRPSFV